MFVHVHNCRLHTQECVPYAETAQKEFFLRTKDKKNNTSYYVNLMHNITNGMIYDVSVS